MIREKDDDGLDLLYRKYKPLITSFSLRYYRTARKYGLELEDMEQEGYVGLSNAIRTFNETNNTMFYTLARVCIDRQMATYVRKCNSKKQQVLNNSCSLDKVFYVGEKELELNKVVPSEKLSPLEEVLDNYMEETIIKRVNNLTFEQGCIFYLKYNNFKIKDICSLLELSGSKVRKELSIIRRRFTSLLSINK